MTDAVTLERTHQNEWYAHAIEARFFEREGFRRLIARNLGYLKRAVPFTRSSRVLSLGCGTGEYELLLAPLVHELVGLDLSPVAVHEARRRATAASRSNLTFLEGSLLDAQFPDARFDVVYALGVLHHLSLTERQQLLQRVRRWLAPGGIFYARDPNATGLLRLGTAACVRHSRFHSPNESALNPRALEAELTAAGLGHPTTGFTDVLLGPLPWLVATDASLFWSLISAFDRAWLAIPGLRRLASQFDVRAER